MNTLRRLIRDRSALLGLIIVAALVLAAVFAWPLPPFRRRHQLRSAAPAAAAGRTYWFGTDRMGGDIYTRLLFGARLTILIAVVATTAAVLIGVPIGLVAGY